MMEKFYPDEYLDSTYEIDFDELYAQGYRGVIFDIDNMEHRRMSVHVHCLHI